MPAKFLIGNFWGFLTVGGKFLIGLGLGVCIVGLGLVLAGLLCIGLRNLGVSILGKCL
jgi:hypothetical protein